MTLLPLLLALEFGEADPELVERLKRRDPQAMADLYDRYGRLVYSVILRIVRDGSTAEDLVQETFLRIWNRVQAFEKEFLTYMRDLKGQIRSDLIEKKELTPELKTALTEAINQFKASFVKGK